MNIMSKEQARSMSPLTLAFYGDSVYELLARKKIVDEGSRPPSKLHEMAVGKVRASAQASAYVQIAPMLSEEETGVFKRGRNACGVTVPKSSTPHDYHCATGLEALFGFLFLTGQFERAEQLYEVICNGE